MKMANKRLLGFLVMTLLLIMANAVIDWYLPPEEGNAGKRNLLFVLATINRDQGRYRPALEYTQRLLELFPDHPDFRELERFLRDKLAIKD